jgi:hypothetical protein
MKISICLIYLLFQFQCYGQRIGVLYIDTAKVFPWLAEASSEYAGVYHFGESEAESEFTLEEKAGKMYAKIGSGEFSADAEKWYWTIDSLTNIRIEGNKFYSSSTDGEFVFYDDEEGRKKGLKVYKPWSRIPLEGEYEIGIKLD